MKITLNKRTVRLALVCGLSVICFGLTNRVQAQLDPSVLGPAWDFTLSGQARGVAQIVFNADGTLAGQVHIETRKKFKETSSNDADGRLGVNPEDRSGGTGSSTNSTASSVTNLFGAFGIDGRWGFDPSTQRIIGFLNEGGIIQAANATNATATTNSVSFRGVVRGGSNPKLTLHGTSPLGSQVFQGIPLQALVDISGSYAAAGSRNGKSVVEFFTLAALGANNYTVANGVSPGAACEGNAILSGRKQLSIVTGELGTNRINVTMAVGGFKTNYVGTSKSPGKLNGRDSYGPVSLKVLNQ